MPQVTSSLQHYLGIARRQAWLVVVTFLCAVIPAYLLVSRESPTCRASMKIVVGERQRQFQPQLSSDVGFFTSTMTILLKSNLVAQTVIDREHMTRSPESLLGAVHVDVRPDSSVWR